MHSMHSDRRYFLFEVARTDEGFGSERVFRYNSILAEGLVEHRGWGLALRAERTDRPENERLLDPFRIAKGHIDFQIIGITQFTIGTVHLAAPAMSLPRMGSTFVTPMIEIARARPEALRTPAVFVPEEFYGASTLWSLTVGLRMEVGSMRARMGRYGVMSGAP